MPLPFGLAATQLAHLLLEVLINGDMDTKSFCNGFIGDIVVGRANSSGGYNEVVLVFQTLDRINDLVLFVWDDCDIFQVDIVLETKISKVLRVCVFDLAVQDLIANDDGGCSKMECPPILVKVFGMIWLL